MQGDSVCPRVSVLDMKGEMGEGGRGGKKGERGVREQGGEGGIRCKTKSEGRKGDRWEESRGAK